MKKILLALPFLVHPLTALGLDLTLPVGSYHLDRSRQWNERNVGLGVVYKDFVGGYYRNSYDRDTYYAGYHWRAWQVIDHVNLGVTAGLVTGYYSPILIVPTLSIETKMVAADIFFAPAVGKSTAFIGMSLRFHLFDD